MESSGTLLTWAQFALAGTYLTAVFLKKYVTALFVMPLGLPAPAGEQGVPDQWSSDGIPHQFLIPRLHPDDVSCPYLIRIAAG